MSAIIWSVSLALFAAGLCMIVLRRELLAMLLGLELMVNAANIALVFGAGAFADAKALSAALLIITIAAAEAVIGLSLILQVFEAGAAPESGSLRELKG